MIEVPVIDVIADVQICSHYIWIIEERSQLRLDFRTFISIYSTYYYSKPDIIYIHTDATPEQWDEAQKSDDQWTTGSLNLPPVKYHKAIVPYETNKGIKIVDIKHRTDFMRVDAVLEFGGLYMDTDVLPIKDIRPLRETGFANVVGNEEVYRINNGILMVCGVMTVESHLPDRSSNQAVEYMWKSRDLASCWAPSFLTLFMAALGCLKSCAAAACANCAFHVG
jgi:hypothetical protein